MERKYYEAYDDRYRQVHAEHLQWFAQTPSPIVSEIMEVFSITPEKNMLEIGCGEGRDAIFLLQAGCRLLATDISPEAIAYCRRLHPGHAAHFQVLDCIGGTMDETFDFIYAVAVVHMLVEDSDRDAFYSFIRTHLKPGGTALVCSMGDGEREMRSDIHTAFDLQERIHEPTGTPVKIAGTSCRMVGFPAFEEEIQRNGLTIVQQGLTCVEPDFPQMMYAVVQA